MLFSFYSVDEIKCMNTTKSIYLCVSYKIFSLRGDGLKWFILFQGVRHLSASKS